MKIKNILIYIVFFIMVISLFGYFLKSPQMHYGGDIIEYYGMSESLINHHSLNLNTQDKTNLIARLGPGYFDNPEYYFKAPNGQRYSGHYFFYSALNVPARLFLRTLNQDELKAFRLTNLLILSGVIFFLIHSVLKTPFKKLALLILTYLSPLVYFMIWPGPEVFMASLLLLSIFLFFQNKKLWAVAAAALASWQSQPLVFIPLFCLASYAFDVIKNNQINKKNIILAILAFLLIISPNLYYFKTFGSFNGLSHLQNIGFGNFSFKKIVEIFFDPNIGLFFYAPILFIGGLIGLVTSLRHKKINYFILGLLVLMAIFYTTITNWNSGTAGYGPIRYALFFIPFFIYFWISYIKPTIFHIIGLVLFALIQLYVLSFNGYLMPKLESTFQLSPYSRFILNHVPGIYNPTPEIFLKRINHKEGKYWETTIYKNDGTCKKAYAFVGRSDMLKEECGFIPTNAMKKLTNEFHNITSYPRTVYTTEATFYPAPGSCAWDYKSGPDTPYVCMKTIEDVMKQTTIKDQGRWEQLDSPGVWKLKWSEPTTVTVPAGYITDYYSLEGVYVNY